MRDRWREWNRELLVMATGTGKTYTAKCIIEDRLRYGSVLFMAHRDELIEQARATFGDAGKVKGSETDIRPITVGSVQTLVNRPAYDGFETLVIDEAHHAVSDSYQKVLAQYPNAKVLGLTATPDRKGLGNVFEGIAYEYGLRDAVRDGYLSPIVARTIPIDIDLTQVKTRVGDFELGGLVEALEPYLPEIAKSMCEYARDRKTVVFLPLVRMAQEFAEMLRDYGFDAQEVNGQSPDRKEKLEWFAQA
ncbi:MAG: DEAD/DEAH box helicase family protein, partial [Atopobiaceae bacterium]|nr:DEAD/DEAH box helicase family protein [Atopobiaceae bacterium]